MIGLTYTPEKCVDRRVSQRREEDRPNVPERRFVGNYQSQLSSALDDALFENGPMCRLHRVLRRGAASQAELDLRVAIYTGMLDQRYGFLEKDMIAGEVSHQIIQAMANAYREAGLELPKELAAKDRFVTNVLGDKKRISQEVRGKELLLSYD